MSQFEIPTITVTAPREEWDELAFVAKLKDAAKPTPDFPISPMTKLVRKASRKFKTTLTASTTFIAPLSWSPPTQLPQLPFISTVKPPKTAIPSIEIEHLGQQLDCIAYFDELVKIMINDLFGPTMLSHRLSEKKRFQYLSNTGLWIDSVTGLKHDLTFNFDDPL